MIRRWIVQGMPGRGQQLLQGPGQEVPEPGVGVAECGLAGFHAHHAGDDGAGYLPADAFDEAAFHFVEGGDEHIAGGGAHDLAEVIGFDLAADGAHVGIEGAYADDDVGGEAETAGPFGTEGTGGDVGRIGIRGQAGGEAF
jgi:hypothetical protein